MSIAGIIVEVQNGAEASVLTGLAQIPQISVYGVKENQIVTVIEGDNAASVNDTVSRVSLFAGVLGVYPVSISEDA
jgi:nitrate reductase NapAB chaperone NapD